MQYKMNHVKRNPANGNVAIRTMFDQDAFPHNVWLIATSSSGAKTATADEVDGWEDIYTPPEDE